MLAQAGARHVAHMFERAFACTNTRVPALRCCTAAPQMQAHQANQRIQRPAVPGRALSPTSLSRMRSSLTAARGLYTGPPGQGRPAAAHEAPPAARPGSAGLQRRGSLTPTRPPHAAPAISRSASYTLRTSPSPRPAHKAAAAPPRQLLTPQQLRSQLAGSVLPAAQLPSAPAAAAAHAGRPQHAGPPGSGPNRRPSSGGVLEGEVLARPQSAGPQPSPHPHSHHATPTHGHGPSPRTSLGGAGTPSPSYTLPTASRIPTVAPSPSPSAVTKAAAAATASPGQAGRGARAAPGNTGGRFETFLRLQGGLIEGLQQHACAGGAAAAHQALQHSVQHMQQHFQACLQQAGELMAQDQQPQGAGTAAGGARWAALHVRECSGCPMPSRVRCMLRLHCPPHLQAICKPFARHAPHRHAHTCDARTARARAASSPAAGTSCCCWASWA